MDFQKIDTEEGEDELFFEGPEPEIAPPAKAARRKAARGKAAAEDAPPPPAEPQPVEDTAPDAPVADAPLADLPAGEPVVILRGARVPMIAMLLAALAALFAAVGLLVMLRNMAMLETARHEVAGREAALARLPALLGEIEALARQQRAALARDAARLPADVATRADLARQMNELRFGLSRMQAPGTAALAGVVRAGQSELADRIGDLGERLDVIERPAAKRAVH